MMSKEKEMFKIGYVISEVKVQIHQLNNFVKNNRNNWDENISKKVEQEFMQIESKLQSLFED